MRPKRTKTFTDDDFTGIVGDSSQMSYDESADSDEDLNFYKEKYSKLLKSNAKTTIHNDSDSDDPFDKLSSFNFIPSLQL